MAELSERIRQATDRLQEDADRLHEFEIHAALEVLIFRLRGLADDLEFDEAIRRERDEREESA